MSTWLYLSVFPESLIASMLPPHEFGAYFATGTSKQSRGQAIFIEVDKELAGNYFPLEDIEERCQPHIDGQPKRSVYLSIYRVLEHLPLSALKSLYLATIDGLVLELPKTDILPDEQRQLHLYQELCPVMPRIATHFNPLDFCSFVTNREFTVSVPRLLFMEMELGGLAVDPQLAPADGLPYLHPEHLRECLVGLMQHPEKPTKTVYRYIPGDLSFAMIRNGFYAGDQEEICHYPFPSPEVMQRDHEAWWRSALAIDGVTL